MATQPSRTLEAVPNQHPDRDYEVSMVADEFTCVCPVTGQPDFATIRIRYVPDKKCVELKSLKLYLQAYRNRGIYYEHVTNVILDDLVKALRPRSITVVGDFAVRGGISSVIEATYQAKPRAGRRTR
jgi:7-cyano-7-deazaguanine reductase